MKRLIFVLLCFAPMARADSLMPSLANVESYLDANSVLPITQQADAQLSRNLLRAQAAPTCTYCGPVSLAYSEDSVLKAITLYLWPGGPANISSEALEPIVWIQSRIAINPDATVSVTPSALFFGEIAVSDPVSTPEPSVLLLFWLGFACVVASWFASRKFRQQQEVIGGGE